jgi:hypothetical protein
LVTLEAGGQVFATVTPRSTSSSALSFYVPFEPQLNGNYLTGSFSLCVTTDARKTCAQQPLTIRALQPVATPVGQTTQQFITALRQYLDTIIDATNPALLPSSLRDQVDTAFNQLSTDVQNTVQGSPSSITAVGPDGNLRATQLTTKAIQDFDALVGNSGLVATTLQKLAEAKSSPLFRHAPPNVLAAPLSTATGPSVASSSEADLLAAAAHYNTILSVNDGIDGTLESKLGKTLMCALDVFSGDSAALVASAVSSVVSGVRYNYEFSKIFLRSIEVNPPTMSLIPGQSAPFRLEGEFVSNAGPSVATTVEDFFKGKIEDRLRQMFGDLSCGSLIPGVDKLDSVISKAADLLVTSLLDGPSGNGLRQLIEQLLQDSRPALVPLSSDSVVVLQALQRYQQLTFSGYVGNVVGVAATPSGGVKNFFDKRWDIASGGLLLEKGSTGQGTLIVNVVPGQPPSVVVTASASGQQSGSSGTVTFSVPAGPQLSVTLSTTGTTPGSGSLVSFDWRDGSRSLGSGPSITVSLSGGFHPILCTVSNSAGLVASGELDIQITSATPPVVHFSMAQLGGSATGQDGQTLTITSSSAVRISLAAQASSSSSVDRYLWTADDGVIGTSQSTYADFPVGTHPVVLEVFDKNGLSSTASATVCIVNNAPRAALNLSGGTQSGQEGSVLKYDVSPGGSVGISLWADRSQNATTYAWFVDGQSAGQARFLSVTLKQGTHPIKLTITNAAGASDSAVASVVITEKAGPAAPVVHFTMTALGQSAHENQTLSLTAAASSVVQISLDGSATGATAGTVVTWKWAGDSVPLACASAACTAYFGNSTNVVTLTVTDSSGSTSSASAQVNITFQQQAPTAHFSMAAQGKSAGEGGTLNIVAPPNGATGVVLTSLSVAGSSSITNYKWQSGSQGVCSNNTTCGVTVGIGNTSITLTVTDSAGKSSSASGTISVSVDPAAKGMLAANLSSFDPRFAVGDKSATLGLLISSSNGSTMSGTIAASTKSGGNWLKVANAASYTWNAPETVTITADPTGVAAGSYSGSFTITSAAASNSPVVVPVSMIIYTALQITTNSLPEALGGASYSAQLEATGGSDGVYTWTLQGGTLPGGLTLSSTGLISGTVAATASTNTTNVSFSVGDSYGHLTSKTLPITWRAGLSISDLWLAPSAQQAQTQLVVGTPHPGFSAQATGGTPPYSWAVTGLPPGLTMASTGQVTGTPTQPGSFQTTFTVTDASGRTGSRTFTIAVTLVALSVRDGNGNTPPSLPSGTTGISYSQYLSASGGSQAGFTWAIVQGSLPPGLSSAPTVTSSCTGCALVISGTPTQAGTYPFTVKLTDSLNNSVQQALTIIINSGTPPQITSPVGLTLGAIGQAYSYTFAATGGSGGYQWSIIGSKPDPSLTLSSAGVLSGTSTVPNDCPEGQNRWVGSSYPSTYFTVQVTDSASQSASKQFCVPSFYPTPQITGFTPASVTLDGAQHTVTVNGQNFRSNAALQMPTFSTVPSTYLSSSALSFVVYPNQSGGAWSPFPPTGSQSQYPVASLSVRVLQPYAIPSNVDVPFTVYNPAPVVTSVTGVGLSGSGPCKVNQSCQLVINGSGFTFDTAYLIKETNATLGYQAHGSTPIPWNTVSTDFFSVSAAGQYTVRVTNTSTSVGTATVEAKFTVTN